MSMQPDEQFVAALRGVLQTRLDEVTAVRRRRHRFTLGAAVLAFLGILSGAGVAVSAATGHLPGSTVSTTLGPRVTEAHTGSAEIELGTPPENANTIRYRLHCLTAGRFTGGQGIFTCGQADATAIGAVPIAPGVHSLSITTSNTTQWTISAWYSDDEISDLAVNASGQTYGAENTKEQPDLIAATATNGKNGYISRAELHTVDGTDHLGENIGTVHYINVYESDGKTVIGKFGVG
jgi:hypothetical protein